MEGLRDEFPNPFDRYLDKDVVREFEQLGKRDGWDLASGRRTLFADPHLRARLRAAEATGVGGSPFLLGLGFLWHLTGRNTLCPTSSLLEALEDTHLRQAPADFARLPYPVTAVFFPRGAGPRLSSTGALAGASLRGMLLCDQHDLVLAVGTSAAQDVATKFSREGREEYFRELERISVRTTRTWSMLALAENGPKTYTDWTTIDLVSEDLDECIQRASQRSVALGGSGDSDRARHYLELSLKLCLWFHSSPDQLEQLPLPTDPRSGRRLSSEARENLARQQRRWGSRVLLGHGLMLPPVQGDPEKGSGHASPLLHHVTGHFKRVAYGEGRSERRVQWIAPYWRGLDQFGRVVERRYLLGRAAP